MRGHRGISSERSAVRKLPAEEGVASPDRIVTGLLCPEELVEYQIVSNYLGDISVASGVFPSAAIALEGCGVLVFLPLGVVGKVTGLAFRNGDSHGRISIRCGGPALEGGAFLGGGIQDDGEILNRVGRGVGRIIYAACKIISDRIGICFAPLCLVDHIVRGHRGISSERSAVLKLPAEERVAGTNRIIAGPLLPEGIAKRKGSTAFSDDLIDRVTVIVGPSTAIALEGCRVLDGLPLGIEGKIFCRVFRNGDSHGRISIRCGGPAEEFGAFLGGGIQGDGEIQNRVGRNVFRIIYAAVKLISDRIGICFAPLCLVDHIVRGHRGIFSERSAVLKLPGEEPVAGTNRIFAGLSIPEGNAKL